MFLVNFVYDDEELLEPYEWQEDDCCLLYTSYLALQLLFSFLKKRKMNYFSIYCFVMGLFALIVL